MMKNRKLTYKTLINFKKYYKKLIIKTNKILLDLNLTKNDIKLLF